MFTWFYIWKRLNSWKYLPAQARRRLFEKLTKSMSEWKKKYLILNYPNGFGFLIVYNALICNKELGNARMISYDE